MAPNERDPVIDEIREARHHISERVGHDVVRLVSYYMELQQQYGDRLIGPARPSEGTDQSAA